MLRAIEVFEAFDGKRFDDADTAAEHVANKAREVFAALLAPLVTGGKMTHNDVFRVVMEIVPDGAAVSALAKALVPMAAYGDQYAVQAVRRVCDHKPVHRLNEEG